MRLLDTNILSEIVRPRPDAHVMGTLLEQESTELFASEMTRYELRRGACLHDDSDHLWQRLRQLVLPLATWLSVTEAISMRGAEIAARLQRSGRGIGDFDPLLVATALEHQLVIVTRNVKHFARIPGLSVENWFADT